MSGARLGRGDGKYEIVLYERRQRLAEVEQIVGEDVRLCLNIGRCARISLIADGEL